MGKKARLENKVRKMVIPEHYERFLQFWTPLTGDKEISSYKLQWPGVIPIYIVELEEGYQWPEYSTKRQQLLAPMERYHDYYGIIKFKDGTIKTRSAYDTEWKCTRVDSE